MSSSGNVIVACLAAPLIIAVLLIAGVSALAIYGERLARALVERGIKFKGNTIPHDIRATCELLKSSDFSASTATARSVNWATGAFEGPKLDESFRASATKAYSSAYDKLNLHSNNSFSQANAGKSANVSSKRLLNVPETATGNLNRSLSATQFALSASSRLTNIPANLNATHKEWSEGVKMTARASAIRDALISHSPLLAVAEATNSNNLKEAEIALNTASAFLSSGEISSAIESAKRAESLFTQTAHQARQTLVKAERITIAATVGNTLEDMGYRVQASGGGNGAAIVGRKDDKTLALVIHSSGRLEMDMAGFEGNDCDTDTNELLKRLKANGLSLSNLNLTHHRKFDGGVMIREAQRKGKILEKALEEMIDELDNMTQTAPEDSPPVHRKSRLSASSDEERLRQGRAWIWGQNQNAQGEKQ